LNRAVACLAFFVLGGCSTAAVDMSEPRRVVGTESSVRVVAEIAGEELRSGSPLAITYEITNQRPTTIAVADIVSATSFDPETHTFTVDIGSEVPGEFLVPRLIAIAPGEKKTFTTAARINFVSKSNAVPQSMRPALRLRVNFLGGDLARFGSLMEMTEKAIADRELADELFPVWIQQNEVLYTNSIPMRWAATRDAAPSPVQRRTPVRNSL
jgi:hypothetical protein